MGIYQRHIEQARDLYTNLHTDEVFSEAVEHAGIKIVTALNEGKTILVAGNGGSAAEAQHLAAEIVGRYKKERRGLPSIALTTDTSILTAVANDYSFDNVFSRQVEALAREGDVLVLLSTSGNSNNLIQAAELAKKQSVTTIALLGKGGGALSSKVDIAVVVPSDDTPRIQELHLLLVHAFSERIDEECA